MDKSFSLLNIFYVILALIKTLSLYNYYYKFNIYFNNYFLNYNLFIKQYKLGINTIRTVLKKLYNFNRYIEEDYKKKPRTLPQSTLNSVIIYSINYPDCEPLKDRVILYSQRDIGIVFFISIIYTKNGFILCLRRRLCNTSSGLLKARRLFDFTRNTNNNTNIKANLLD